MLKCPKCKKGIHQKYAAWTNTEPSISKRAYDCQDCKTRFLEIVEVGSCKVLGIVEEKFADRQSTLDFFMGGMSEDVGSSTGRG